MDAGGETAAMGAIAGAAAGALHGTAGLPDRLSAQLANRKQLKVRAGALAVRKWKKSRIENLYDMEYGLTRREHEERLARMRKAGIEFPAKGKTQKISAPQPIEEKYDAKKFRRQQRRLKEWARYLPPEDNH